MALCRSAVVRAGDEGRRSRRPEPEPGRGRSAGSPADGRAARAATLWLVGVAGSSCG